MFAVIITRVVQSEYVVTLPLSEWWVLGHHVLGLFICVSQNFVSTAVSGGTSIYLVHLETKMH